MLQLVKKPGGAVYALFVALLLSLLASGFSIQKGVGDLSTGAIFTPNVFVFIVYVAVLVVLLFLLGSEYGVLSVVCAEIVFLMLIYLSFFTEYYASFALSGLLLSGTLAYYMRKDSLEDALGKIGLQRKNIYMDIAYGLGGFAIALVVSVVLASVLGAIGIEDSALVQQSIFGMPLLVLLWAVSITPIAEEMFFRGLVLQKFGMVPSSILFALMHVFYGSIVEVGGAFCIAIVFCYLARKRKNIVAPIIAHIAFNVFSIVAALYL